MARATKKPLTGKQQEIVDLMKGKPDITPAEIAELLETSPGAIYQQVSRLRAAGHLPKSGKATAKRGGRGRASAPTPAPGPDFEEMIPPTSNGSLTLVEHVERDLKKTVERMDEIQGQRAALEDEEGTLTELRARLTAAQTALSGVA